MSRVACRVCVCVCVCVLCGVFVVYTTSSRLVTRVWLCCVWCTPSHAGVHRRVTCHLHAKSAKHCVSRHRFYSARHFSTKGSGCLNQSRVCGVSHTTPRTLLQVWQLCCVSALHHQHQLPRGASNKCCRESAQRGYVVGGRRWLNLRVRVGGGGGGVGAGPVVYTAGVHQRG